MENKKNKLETKVIVGIAVFSALAFVLSQVIRFPVMFLTFDVKDAIICISAFIYGPIAAPVVSLIAALLELITNISGTGVYGFLMNFLSSASLAMVASLVYSKRRTLNGAIVSLVLAVIAMVAVMMVNNETGARFDVARVFAAAKAKDSRTVTHCDAVQGFLKVPFTPAGIHADLVTVSAHKIHGPKGVGALYVHPDMIKTKRIVPYLTGGGQESGLRSGTENTVGICGFGAAAQAGYATRGADFAKMTALRDRLEGKLREMGVQMNIPAADRAPHILNLTLPDIKSQTMLNYLSAKGICVSSGSACSSHSTKVGPSLAAFGLSAHEADCSLRVSFSAQNTEAEVDALCEALEQGISTLVRIRR